MAAESISEKYCWSCKTTKAVLEFPKNRTKPGGLGTECKACRRIQDKTYHARYREKHLARFKAYKKANPEYFKKYARDYYKENQKNIRARSKACYAAKTPEILAQQKARRDSNLEEFHQKEHQRYWEKPEVMRANRRRHYKKNASEHNRKVVLYQQLHPEMVKEWKRRWLINHPERRRIAMHNNKAMRRRGKGRFTLEQLLAKYEFHGWRCYLCQIPITFETSHPDHRKPLGRGGTNWIANIAPACIKCNLTKNRRTESEYRVMMAA